MDATIQIGEINEKNSEDSDESVCPSDCSSCYIQSKQKRTMALRKKLLEAPNGNESLLDGIVVQMLDNSCLNHSQIELAQSKRKKIPDELAVDVDLDMLMICIDKDLEEEAKAVPSNGGTKKRKLDQFKQMVETYFDPSFEHSVKLRDDFMVTYIKMFDKIQILSAEQQFIIVMGTLDTAYTAQTEAYKHTIKLIQATNDKDLMFRVVGSRQRSIN